MVPRSRVEPSGRVILVPWSSTSNGVWGGSVPVQMLLDVLTRVRESIRCVNLTEFRPAKWG